MSASNDSWRAVHVRAQSRSDSSSEVSVQDNGISSTSGAEVGAAADFAAEFAVRSEFPAQLQPALEFDQQQPALEFAGLTSNQLWVPMARPQLVDHDGLILVGSAGNPPWTDLLISHLGSSLKLPSSRLDLFPLLRSWWDLLCAAENPPLIDLLASYSGLNCWHHPGLICWYPTLDHGTGIPKARFAI